MGHNSNYVKVEDAKNLFRVNNCQVRSVERTAVNEVGKDVFTKSTIAPINKFSSNPRFSKSKLRNEQKKVLNFTRGYFSTSVRAPTALDDTVKKDPDPGRVNVRYKLKPKKDDDDVEKHIPSATKYTERNDRGLALLITAEERKETEDLNVDELRFRFPKKTEAEERNSESDDEKKDSDNDDEKNEDKEDKQEEKEDNETETEENEEDNLDEVEEVKKVTNTNSKKKLEELKESSTRRKRWKNFKYSY